MGGHGWTGIVRGIMKGVVRVVGSQLNMISLT